MHTNYRESHVGKGSDYHDKFIRGPYRSVVWDIEQEQILSILESHRAGTTDPVRLLDFACGTGRILQLLEPRVDSSVGVDVSKTMLEVAESHLTRSELMNVDLTREPALSDRKFEMITAFRFFPNAEPELRDDVMRELATLLAPGGILILNNHLRCAGTKMRLRRLLHWLTGGGRRLTGGGRGLTGGGRAGRKKNRDLHCMSDAEVASLASRFGLAIRETQTLAVLPVLKEKRPLLPKSMLVAIEKWAANRPFLKGLSNTHIYVLGHVESAGTGPDASPPNR